mmetsp:Transcript_19771/g.30047  ORF Transcript_19771/g.30047 Transcript_19771/m.30047 type:complete len:131 (-) Transcript_19771:392-784(-)
MIKLIRCLDEVYELDIQNSTENKTFFCEIHFNYVASDMNITTPMPSKTKAMLILLPLQRFLSSSYSFLFLSRHLSLVQERRTRIQLSRYHRFSLQQMPKDMALQMQEEVQKAWIQALPRILALLQLFSPP